jgi:hypothetical protein
VLESFNSNGTDRGENLGRFRGSFRGGAKNAVQQLEPFFDNSRAGIGSSFGTRSHFSGPRRSRAGRAQQQRAHGRGIPGLVPGHDRCRGRVLRSTERVRARRRMVHSGHRRRHHSGGIPDQFLRRTLLLRLHRGAHACERRPGAARHGDRGRVLHRSGGSRRPDHLRPHPSQADGHPRVGDVPVHPSLWRGLDRRGGGSGARHLLHRGHRHRPPGRPVRRRPEVAARALPDPVGHAGRRGDGGGHRRESDA